MIRDKIETERYTLYLGDCLDVLPKLGSVDAVVTDPPYGIVNEFGAIETVNGCKSGSRTMQFKWDKAAVDWKAVFGSVKNADAAFVFTGFDTIGPIQDAMRLFNLTPKPFAWVKTCPPPPMPGNWWPSAFETAIYAYRSGAWFGDDNPKRRNVYVGDSLRAGNGEKNGHPTQKPLALMLHIVDSIVPPDGTCLDCFMGSGTTGVACMKLGRKFIGIEIDPNYFAIAAKRIAKAAEEPPLFKAAREAEQGILALG